MNQPPQKPQQPQGPRLEHGQGVKKTVAAVDHIIDSFVGEVSALGLGPHNLAERVPALAPILAKHLPAAEAMIKRADDPKAVERALLRRKEERAEKLRLDAPQAPRQPMWLNAGHGSQPQKGQAPERQSPAAPEGEERTEPQPKRGPGR